MATAITLGGQLTIKWAERELNDHLNRLFKTNGVDYVIASDTDSLYITLAPLVRAVFSGPALDDRHRVATFLADAVEKGIMPVLGRIFKDLAVRMGAYSERMEMKREAIADRGVWTAKKRYILHVYDNEGVRYEKPKLKIKGIEAVKSSTPRSCREAIKAALKIMMTGNESQLAEYVTVFRKQFDLMPFEEIAFPRGLSSLNGYKSTVPIHARGAKAYNAALVRFKLTKWFEAVKDGDKVLWTYLLTPNPVTNENVFSVPTMLPREFGLDAYVDRDTQFQKAFLDPLGIVLDAIGWKTNSKAANNLESHFI